MSPPFFHTFLRYLFVNVRFVTAEGEKNFW